MVALNASGTQHGGSRTPGEVASVYNINAFDQRHQQTRIDMQETSACQKLVQDTMSRMGRESHCVHVCFMGV